MRLACFLILFTLCFNAWSSARGISVTYRESDSPDARVAGVMELYSKSYALVIGIDHYTNDWPRLSNAINDARKVAMALSDKGFEVTLKTDLKSRELELALEDFFIDKGADANAQLFIWFAGHGHTVNGEGYLIPADGVAASDKRNFRRTALSLRRFSELARLADAKHVYTVFDSCFAGTVFNVARSAAPPAITRVTAEPVRQFLTSGDAGQQVSDDGTFARLFVEALAGNQRADLNNDGYLTAEELGGYLTNELSNASNNTQVPRHGKLRDPKFNRGDFVFLASVPHRQAMPDLPAAPGKNDFSLADLTKQAEAEKIVKAAWAQNQRAMEAAFKQVRTMDGENINASLKINAWQRFEQAFADNNPYATADDNMLAEAQQRIGALKLEPAAAQAATTSDTSKPEVFVTNSGLQYQVLRTGNGRSPGPTDEVTVHYEGRLTDGSVFDSSYARGEPATFRLNQVIRGWTEGLQLMREGGKWQLTIPPELAYAGRKIGSIPANSVLVFDVELLKVEGGSE